MTIDEIKRKVSKETGVPQHLLTGETEEECKARALAVTAFMREYRAEHGDEFSKPEPPKSTAQQFAEWLEQTGQLHGIEGIQDPAAPGPADPQRNNAELFGIWAAAQLGGSW